MESVKKAEVYPAMRNGLGELILALGAITLKLTSNRVACFGQSLSFLVWQNEGILLCCKKDEILPISLVQANLYNITYFDSIIKNVYDYLTYL